MTEKEAMELIRKDYKSRDGQIQRARREMMMPDLLPEFIADEDKTDFAVRDLIFTDRWCDSEEDPEGFGFIGYDSDRRPDDKLSWSYGINSKTGHIIEGTAPEFPRELARYRAEGVCKPL